jgi:Fur family transcriptional regulator, ferric uptake regulator
VKINEKYRMTNQRQVILEEIQKVRTHPTADEIYQMVRRRIPNISLGTVYRNLEILHECGLIKKLELGRSQKRFDGYIDEHYHIRCMQCGKVGDLAMDVSHLLDQASMSGSDFKILDHRLEFLGICAECQLKKVEKTH